jgi:hypothetical protein
MLRTGTRLVSVAVRLLLSLLLPQTSYVGSAGAPVHTSPVAAQESRTERARDALHDQR